MKLSLENMASSRVWRRASIQRVVPREETLSHLIPNCYSIVIAPIYSLRVTNLWDSNFACHQFVGHSSFVELCVWLKVGDDQGSSLGLRTAVSWDLVFDTEAPPREGGGAWGFVFAH